MLHGIDVHFLIILLIILVVLSAVFSSAETGMMSLNRYRLRHLAKQDKRSAKRVVNLLKRPDRILGVILLGNTFANILASAVATIIAVYYFGGVGVWLSTIAITLLVLIFAETLPKTYAALYPEKVAFPFSGFLSILLKVLYPLVWLINGIANGLLRMVGVKLNKGEVEPLSREELRQVVLEAGSKISGNYQYMLLRVLDLEQISVDDVMVPRSEIYGIDLEDEWDTIVNRLVACDYSYVLVYEETIDQLKGLVLVRHALAKLVQGQLTKDNFSELAEPVHFIPEGTLLGLQLRHFQQRNQYLGLVVDEYGDIQGLVNVDDVLEEIVGEFAEDVADTVKLVKALGLERYLVDGSIHIRDLNRLTKYDLPTDGPKTLSGFIIEQLEMIPVNAMCLQVGQYRIEIKEINENMVKTVQLARVHVD